MSQPHVFHGNVTGTMSDWCIGTTAYRVAMHDLQQVTCSLMQGQLLGVKQQMLAHQRAAVAAEQDCAAKQLACVQVSW